MRPCLSPLASADKALRLAAARAELKAIEIKVADLWWQAEGDGILLPVPRDIDPATFLGITNASHPANRLCVPSFALPKSQYGADFAAD